MMGNTNDARPDLMDRSFLEYSGERKVARSASGSFRKAAARPCKTLAFHLAAYVLLLALMTRLLGLPIWDMEDWLGGTGISGCLDAILSSLMVVVVVVVVSGIMG